MQGATTRRTPMQVPGYDASLGNLWGLTKEIASFFGGPVGTAAKAVSGYGPSYGGYTGHVNTPGSYDPKGGPQLPGQSVGLSSDIERMLLTGGYGGANRAVYTPGMKGTPQMFADAMNPRPAPAQSPGLMFKPQTYQPQEVRIPGAFDYGVKFDPWKYFA